MRLSFAFFLLASATHALALEPIPDKLVVLTLDDASKSHVTVAAPLLKKHGFGATFFVTEGFDFPTNNRDYMSWPEIAGLHRDGCEIANHTRDHKALSANDPKGSVARYVDPDVVPSNPWGVIEDRKKLLSSGRDGSNTRPARSDAELRGWLVSMLVHHRYTSVEAGAGLGLTADQVSAAAKRMGISADRPNDRHPRVLPYPGGRHPRIGFLDGAIRPQRETKVSIFAPWADGGYAVADVPEAVWHDTPSGRRKLLFLAHTHVPTLWDERGQSLPTLEWTAKSDGSLELSRTLPNQVMLTSRVTPGDNGTRTEFRVTNRSSETLTGLDVQMCVMLKGLTGFATLSNDNKVFQPPFAAAHDTSGRRWIITAWDHCERAWGNAACPCLHSDPRVPDCPPGESRSVSGWTSFYEGADIQGELKRLAGILAIANESAAPAAVNRSRLSIAPGVATLLGWSSRSLRSQASPTGPSPERGTVSRSARRRPPHTLYWYIGAILSGYIVIFRI